MRVAIPVTAGQIPNHFGHCESSLTAEGLDAGGCGRHGHAHGDGHHHQH